ncbi:MAG TPA: hypothetical protein VK171_12505, partial [Fimbriimonas sp.]|nr:hypothetical protein [Fimbriimonas sp.]
MINQFTPKERNLASLVHIAAIFMPFLGPIIGYFISSSKYVKFHALKAIVEQVITSLIIGFLMICSLSYSIYTFYQSQSGGFDLSKIDWVAMLVKAAITWVLLAIWNLINIALSLKDAAQANRGQLPAKPK